MQGSCQLPLQSGQAGGRAQAVGRRATLVAASQELYMDMLHATHQIARCPTG